MCLTPIRLRTNTKYFHLGSYKKLYVDVPCGKCVECQQQKKNEWYLRNYYEAEDTWNKGGYILFDTLTYDDAHLPSSQNTILGFDLSEQYSFWKLFDWMIENHYLDGVNDGKLIGQEIHRFMDTFGACDFSCFRYTDVQSFLKNLRIRLTRDGYDVKSSLRYFLSSEYGHDEHYIDQSGRTRKGTNRPHYHILFYVSNPSIDPLYLSQMISDCWYFGRTDGYAYRGSAYVYNNCFGPRYIKDPNRLRGVQYYVTKYVCKDYEFAENVDVRICKILRDIYGLSFTSRDYSDKRRFLHRFMDQFHRQSVGFGLTALDSTENFESIWNHGYITVPDKEKITKNLPIPMYYVRKLFQECVKDSEGRLHWVWNDLGRQWRKLAVERSVDTLAQKMQDWYNNLNVYCPDDYENWRYKVEKILCGRNFTDYARYVIYYKGRVCFDRYDISELKSDSEVLDRSLAVSPEFGENVMRLYADGVYRLESDGDEAYIDVSALNEYFIIHDDVCEDFEGFDRLFQIYQISMIKWNQKRQQAYEEKLRLQKSLKELGFKCKKKI